MFSVIQKISFILHNCDLTVMASRTFFVFLFFYHLMLVGVSPVKNNSTFTPTHQWKKVEEGQAIPSGLHVRINLQSGEKEAKLPDSENNSKKSLIVTDDKGNDADSEKTYDSEKLKALLKNIKGEETSGEGVSHNFRSYEKLKKDLSKLQIQTKSDVEIMKDLIKKFKKLNVLKFDAENTQVDEDEEDKEIEQVLTVLEDLEYLVHQYDNAQEFAKQNGFSDVIYACLNSTIRDIRSQALTLLGSATQSNPKVQVAALESGAIHLLLKILTFDSDIIVRSRSLYALSCLIRRFPAAQHKLIKDGGLTAFAKIFDQEKVNLVVLQVKVITLIHDLLFERKDTKMNILEEENRNQTDSKVEMLKERLQQYENINLEKKLVEQEWCKRVSDWFLKQSYIKDLNRDPNSGMRLENVNLEPHDLIEKVVDTLYVLSDICKPQFQSDKDFIDLLFILKDIYGELAEAESNKSKDEDDSTQFYTGLFNVLKMLTDKLKRTDEKDEL